MKTLAFWAHNHVWTARILLVALGFFKAGIGLIIGFRLFQGFAAVQLHGFIISLALIGLALTKLYHSYKIDDVENRIRIRFRFNSALYGLSFAIMMLSGGLLRHVEDDSTTLPYVVANASLSIPNGIPTPNAQNIAKVRKVSKWKLWLKAKVAESEAHYSILGLVVLFLLAAFATFFGSGIACILACAGYEFAAALVAIGVLGSGILGLYFLYLSIMPRAKRAKRTQKQLRRDRLLALILGLFSLFVLLFMIIVM